MRHISLLAGIVIVLNSAFFLACSSTQKQAKKINTRPEFVTMNISEDPLFYEELSRSNPGPATRGIPLPFTGTAVSLAKNAVLNLIENEEQRLTNTFKQAQTDLYFYNKISLEHPLDPTGMQFDGVKVAKVQGNGANTDTTFYASFTVDTSNPIEILNNSIFRLKLDELTLYDTELPNTKRWFLPWTWFDNEPNTINLDITIKIYGSWIDDDMAMKKNERMGEFYLVLRNMPFHGSKGYTDYVKNAVDTQLTGYSYMIPRSMTFQRVNDRIEKIYGHGLYSLEVEVVESRKPGSVSRTTTEIIQKSKLLE